MDEEKLDKIITEALCIEAEDAKKAGSVGFMARALTQATMPHKRIQGSEFTRDNGLFTLTILAPSSVGLPYGVYPRLLLSWMTTEAVRTKDRYLELGPTLSGFMAELGLAPTGGRWGSITRLRDQMERLFRCYITCLYREPYVTAITNIKPVSEAKFWWDPMRPHQAILWRSYIVLDQDFFNEITKAPVPIDMRALKVLKRSPMALDIYNWLTYRLSYLKERKIIPWQALQLQFGSEYAHLRNFKINFIKHLQSVLAIYPEAKVQPLDTGLELRPSKPHVPMLER